MAALTIINPVLIALSGPLKGKKFPIKKDQFTLGGSLDSDVNVPGDQVSKNHAVVEKDQFGLWNIVSKSEVGVLVNKKAVQRASLSIGDVVQIGEVTLFKFEGKAVKTASRKESASLLSGEGIKIKKPILYLLGAYLLLMLGVGIYFSIDINNEIEPGLSSKYVQSVLDSTKDYLKEITPETTNKSLNITLDSNRDLSASYYNIKYSKNTSNKEDYINKLLVELERAFFRAWTFEQTGDMQQALNEYRKILSMVPDNDAVTTKVANWRLLTINEKINNAR